jgi:hypothetical protein
MSELPALEAVIMLDWSVAASKRWGAWATRDAQMRWCVRGVEPVSDAPLDWIDARHASDAATLIGLDMTLGAPLAWAERAQVTSFRALLAAWLGGDPAWARFGDVARDPDEISLTRPFFPRVAKRGVKLDALVQALGLPDADALRRRCDLPQPGHTTPCPLFWTVGANQVGKATLAGWRELVWPLLTRGAHLWPHDSADLQALLHSGDITLAEVYPANALRALLDESALKRHRAAGGKRAIDGRLAAEALLRHDAMRDAPAALLEEVASGFASHGEAGEDPFDALVGALFMLNVLERATKLEVPDDPLMRQVEGFIMNK